MDFDDLALACAEAQRIEDICNEADRTSEEEGRLPLVNATFHRGLVDSMFLQAR